MSTMLFNHSNDCASRVKIICLIICLIKKVKKSLKQLDKKNLPSETRGCNSRVVSFVEEKICVLLMRDH